MDSVFVYYKPVTGKNYIGNDSLCKSIGNLLLQEENILLYAPPKSGRKSTIQNSLLGLRSRGESFNTVDFSFMNIRDAATAFGTLGSGILRAAGLSVNHESIETLLEGSCWQMNPEAGPKDGNFLYPGSGEALSENDIDTILRLPSRLEEKGSGRTFVVLDEFQNILLLEEGENILHIMERSLKRIADRASRGGAFIFTGSSFNAMREIFDVRKFFFRQFEKLEIPQIEAKDIIEHIIKGFLVSGKVVDKELLLGACKLFRGNMWYMRHFASLCDSFSKGYIMEPIFLEALDAIISIHQPRFESTMNNLTSFQVNLLKAIVNGETRFSSAETIRKYDLNSSANVRRLKDALCKKEIVTPGRDEELIILDPLFEYWVGKYYFCKKD